MSRKLYHGTAWYPELWDESVILHDIAKMREAGINVVRIGEFAWSTMEPTEGAIDVSLFAKVMTRLHAEGIDTVMCTPTATPPIWLTHQHPERLHVDDRGVVMGHGSRQHICTNNKEFRQRAALITEAIASELGRMPGLIGWQLDNEFKAHVAACHCQNCLSLWQEWLKQRYGTIEALNEAWGAAIWSQQYERFEQVPHPGPTPFLHSTSMQTAHRQFSMASIAEFADEQAAIIRRFSDAPVTHNSSVAFHVDNERLFERLDFASFDTYASAENYPAYLINCDLFRNYKPGRGYWLMETSPSNSGSIQGASVPHPQGYVAAEAAAAYALGADAFCYWHWRQHRSGCEQPHGSVLSAWGKPTIGWTNALEVEEARRVLEPLLLGSQPAVAETALVYSDRAKAFMATEPLKGMNYRGLMTGFYGRLLAMGIHRDVVPENVELEGRKLLLTPFLPYVSETFIGRAMAFAERGGVWIIGPFTGGRTEEHTIQTDAALGKLEQLAGVEAVFSYPLDGSGAIGEAFGMKAPLGMWGTVFETHGASSVGTLVDGLTPGLSFLTEHRVGDGLIVMLGAMPMGEEGDAMLRAMLDHYASCAGVTLRTDATSGTLVAPRVESDGRELWVIVNMDGRGGTVTIPDGTVDALTGEPVAAGSLAVERYAYRVVRLREEE
ncbi:beta-galactosidase [Paenibacillus cellulosilyticus]|uniref:Beta-galactosidase n=1 Tax=Paenibacillus cellulosilyticus TaxID=375489 RepID=A0A2V2YE35_9BACL|nr:beta-galactosidase [Paenibacillus cellulosilyticus]PWV90541.1 beta-galactosidase [Paenibacillus cellulosilyticus]QKS47077.1 beta-galactosidase [Paenibacillus cellulosilyticus]